MNFALAILLAVLIFFSIFALYFENKDRANSYTLGKSSENDSINTSIRKLHICMSYDIKAIKWRRILLATGTSLLLIFSLVHHRLPSPKEFLLYFVIIFMCFEISWRTYTSHTSTEAIKYGEENISRLRQTLLDERSFVLPW